MTQNGQYVWVYHMVHICGRTLGGQRYRRPYQASRNIVEGALSFCRYHHDRPTNFHVHRRELQGQAIVIDAIPFLDGKLDDPSSSLKIREEIS